MNPAKLGSFVAMTTHSLAIAKASLAAGMMRPDPAPVTRAEVGQLHEALEASTQPVHSSKYRGLKAESSIG